MSPRNPRPPLAAAPGSPPTGVTLAEERRRQQEMHERVGRLAGGIAHEVNNMMTVVLGVSHLLQCRLGAQNPAAGDIAQILTAAQRTTDLTQQVLSYSRRQVLQTKELDAGALLRDCMTRVKDLVGPRVQVRWAVDTGNLGVRSDPELLVGALELQPK